MIAPLLETALPTIALLTMHAIATSWAGLQRDADRQLSRSTLVVAAFWLLIVAADVLVRLVSDTGGIVVHLLTAIARRRIIPAPEAFIPGAGELTESELISVLRAVVPHGLIMSISLIASAIVFWASFSLLRWQSGRDRGASPDSVRTVRLRSVPLGVLLLGALVLIAIKTGRYFRYDDQISWVIGQRVTIESRDELGPYLLNIVLAPRAVLHHLDQFLASGLLVVGIGLVPALLMRVRWEQPDQEPEQLPQPETNLWCLFRSLKRRYGDGFEVLSPQRTQHPPRNRKREPEYTYLDEALADLEQALSSHERTFLRRAIEGLGFHDLWLSQADLVRAVFTALADQTGDSSAPHVLITTETGSGRSTCLQLSWALLSSLRGERTLVIVPGVEDAQRLQEQIAERFDRFHWGPVLLRNTRVACDSEMIEEAFESSGEIFRAPMVLVVTVDSLNAMLQFGQTGSARTFFETLRQVAVIDLHRLDPLSILHLRFVLTRVGLMTRTAGSRVPSVIATSAPEEGLRSKLEDELLAALGGSVQSVDAIKTGYYKADQWLAELELYAQGHSSGATAPEIAIEEALRLDLTPVGVWGLEELLGEDTLEGRLTDIQARMMTAHADHAEAVHRNVVLLTDADEVETIRNLRCLIVGASVGRVHEFPHRFSTAGLEQPDCGVVFVTKDPLEHLHLASHADYFRLSEYDAGHPVAYTGPPVPVTSVGTSSIAPMRVRVDHAVAAVCEQGRLDAKALADAFLRDPAELQEMLDRIEADYRHLIDFRRSGPRVELVSRGATFVPVLSDAAKWQTVELLVQDRPVYPVPASYLRRVLVPFSRAQRSNLFLAGRMFTVGHIPTPIPQEPTIELHEPADREFAGYHVERSLALAEQSLRALEEAEWNYARFEHGPRALYHTRARVDLSLRFEEITAINYNDFRDSQHGIGTPVEESASFEALVLRLDDLADHLTESQIALLADILRHVFRMVYTGTFRKVDGFPVITDDHVYILFVDLLEPHPDFPASADSYLVVRGRNSVMESALWLLHWITAPDTPGRDRLIEALNRLFATERVSRESDPYATDDFSA
ncbi:MAG: hypothetical protein ACOCVK_02280, partial [bacterium]